MNIYNFSLWVAELKLCKLLEQLCDHTGMHGSMEELPFMGNIPCKYLQVQLLPENTDQYP